MLNLRPAGDERAVSDAVRDAYRAAEVPEVPAVGHIAPLRHLVAGAPLNVDEVPDLTRRRAAAFLAPRLGRLLDQPVGTDEPLAGFLYAGPEGGWILVRAQDPLVRRRFTIAHELGHYLLHVAPALAAVAAADLADDVEFDEALPAAPDAAADAPSGGRVRVLSGRDPGAEADRLEAEADRFAALLLMPAALCHLLVREHAPRCGRAGMAGWRDVVARRLASELLVSQAAMRRRLDELGLP